MEAVVEGAVKTTFDIPRIGAQMSTGASGASSNKTSASSIPTMALDDESVVNVRFRDWLVHGAYLLSLHWFSTSVPTRLCLNLSV